MRVDRLIAITIYLLNREIVSAAALAERFEVSKRTIQRDIEALNQAGIPISSTFGVDGGYAIMDGFKLTKQIVRVDDYLNIIIALKGLSSAYDGPKIRETLDKALSAMQDGEQRLFVDLSAAREGVQVNEHLRNIDSAISERKPLRIHYTNAQNVSSERVIEPLALSYRWYAWYLFAYCTMRQDYRIFKLTRITRCEPVSGVFSKEHGNVESLMATTRFDDRECWHVKLLCRKSFRQQALEYLSAHIVDELPNGDCILELHVPFERTWFSLLLGFGNGVEVIEPDDLKALLKQKAEEILSIY